MSINATLLGQTLAFIIFVWCCMKFVWPPLMNAIEARQKRIADGLADADRAVKDLELAQAKATDQLKEAKVTANEIIEQANKRKAQIVEEAKAEADAERAKIIAQGKAEIEAERRNEPPATGVRASALGAGTGCQRRTPGDQHGRSKDRP